MTSRPDGFITSRPIGNRSVIPRTIDVTRNFVFGDGDGMGLVLPVKTTTGNPSSPAEGQCYVNTFDNAVRVYADGAWRDLVTW